MAAFRRLVIALAVLAVFAGLASAQTLTPMQCSVTPSSPNIRTEGKTEQVGDLQVDCSSGNPLVDGAAIPRANFTVTISSGTITSRVMSTSSTTPPVMITDSLLLIDQPGTTTNVFGGFGSDQPPTLCPSAGVGSDGGCTAPAFKQTVGGQNVMSSVSSPTNAGATATAPNVFQGVLSGTGTSVTFFNVPLLPVGQTVGRRVFRITNIRVDATGGQSTISESISLSLSSLTTGVTIGGLIQINGSSSGAVGTVMSGLSTDLTKVAFFGSAPVCIGTDPNTPKYVAAISFGEKFSTAFKTRTAGTAAANSVFNTPQNTPGGPFLGESGYTPATTIVTGGIGVADFGTRLKATFSNIPAGVRLFVSATNMVNTTSGSAGSAVGDLIGNAEGSNVPTSFAELIGTADTTPDSGSGPPAVLGPGPVELTVSTTGGATAVWEVVNTNPSASETLTFAIYLIYAAGVPPVTGTPTQPSPTVNLSYAPTYTPPATGTILHPIPNFVDADSIKGKVFDLSSCRTVLLFPYVTAGGGFDTGISIANTTSDSPVFSDTPQSGTCELFLYPAPAGITLPISFGPVASGTVFAATLSSLVTPPYNGYMIASCPFQLAHGFIFVADWGNPATSSAMGYLALVIPDVGNLGSRTAGSPTGENLNN